MPSNIVYLDSYWHHLTAYIRGGQELVDWVLKSRELWHSAMIRLLVAGRLVAWAGHPLLVGWRLQQTAANIITKLSYPSFPVLLKLH